MKILPLAIAVLIAAIDFAMAEITPMIIKVSSTATGFVDTYTVPSGKVLLIENYTLYAYQEKLVRLYKGSDVVPLSPEWTPPQRPLKIPAGWTIKIDKVSVGTTYYAFLFCLLVDPADLYAYIPNEIKSFDVAGTTGSLLVELAAARPSRIAVERSPDLQDWDVDAQAAVLPDLHLKTRHHITVNSTNAVQFFRSTAKAVR